MPTPKQKLADALGDVRRLSNKEAFELGVRRALFRSAPRTQPPDEALAAALDFVNEQNRRSP